MISDWPDALDLGPVTVLSGIERGKYPHGNSVLVQGTRETVLFDPSLTIAELGAPKGIDHVVLSHVHEDHIPGLSQIPDVPVHCHEADALGLRSLDGMMEIYGMPPEIDAEFRKEIVTDFHYAPRSEVRTFTDGATFDLGGVTIEVMHTPGHTRGHCALVVPEARTAYLGDIELTGFGPYYGDAWSCLEDFEDSIQKCKTIDADHFITFHHKWVISDRALLHTMLDEFQAVIDRRNVAMLEFLAEPHSIDDCVAKRFVYRPHVDISFASSVETRCAQQHIDRFVRNGQVSEVEPGLFRTS
ncbi:MAG: MBL fold metallo-hydrolase [Acidimicrobiales bacterium]|jgi:glyoxylase-like metal-dependent hydrolase (beta-lactamase superfamily II)